jgi:hypothetical protein
MLWQMKELIMEIFFGAQLSSPEPPAFILTLEPEAISLQGIADMVSLSAQAPMRRNSDFWGQPSYQDFRPILSDLHGILYVGNPGIGASLPPSDNFPLPFINTNSQLLNLAFHCSRSYLQYIEEQRSSNPGSYLTLSFYFWALMSMVSTIDPAPVYPKGSVYPEGSILIHSRQGTQLSISRSHWSDMLSTIDYPQRRYIELPTLSPQVGAEELHKALAHLNEAHVLFAQDRYREAVQRCRQARDVLLGEDKPTWAEKVLAPIILAEKAAMINESIKALNNLGNQASHGAGIEVDRDTANYVIGSLTLILDYIGRKLR